MYKKIAVTVIVLCFLGACCYQGKAITPTTSVEKNMKLVNETLRETLDAVDILSDDTLSVDERVRLYHKRMDEINKKLSNKGS